MRGLGLILLGWAVGVGSKAAIDLMHPCLPPGNLASFLAIHDCGSPLVTTYEQVEYSVHIARYACDSGIGVVMVKMEAKKP